MRLSCYKLKKRFIFQEGTDKALKANKKSAHKKFLVFFNVLVIFTAVRYRKISRDYLYSTAKHIVIPCNYLYIILYEINESKHFSTAPAKRLESTENSKIKGSGIL